MKVVNSNNIDLTRLKGHLKQGDGILVWLTLVDTGWILRIIKEDSNNEFKCVSPFYNLKRYDERLLVSSVDELIDFIASLIEETDANNFYWFPTEEDFLNWCQSLGKGVNDA